MVSEVCNIALSVSDLQRSVRFYTEVFDFVLVGDVRTSEGCVTSSLVEVAGAQLTIQFVRKSDLTIELFTFTAPNQVAGGGFQPLNRIGGFHLAFFVDDLGEVGEAIENHEGTVHWDSRISLGPLPERPPRDFMYCFDPDGIRIELLANSTAD